MIYLDHHATTPPRPVALEAMRPWLSGERFGNASSAHAAGRAARQALEDARERVAGCLGAQPGQVVFTSGATEANNLALFGLAGAEPLGIATSAIEHPCVLEPIRRLVARGHRLYELPVSATGHVVVDQIPEDVRVVAVMAVNHETGAIQPPVPTSGTWHWHCDAAQAAGKRPISFRELGAATLSISGHKFGGPQGVGALLVREGVRLRPLLVGGPQQNERRAGTEPVALAVGLAAALDEACRSLAAETHHVDCLRSQFLGQINHQLEQVVVNSPNTPGTYSPYVVNVSFPGVRADALLMALDVAGVACSAGSACSSGSLLPSPVLRAMNLPDDVVRSAVRFSFAPTTTPAEVGTAAGLVVAAVKRLRASAAA